MNEPLIMLLSAIVIFHAISRLSTMPSIVHVRWRAKLLIVSILCEVIGAFSAFGDAYTSTQHYYSVTCLLLALAIAPVVDQRLSKRLKHTVTTQ